MAYSPMMMGLSLVCRWCCVRRCRSSARVPFTTPSRVRALRPHTTWSADGPGQEPSRGGNLHSIATRCMPILDPADGRVLVGVAAAAVATDLALRSGVAGLAGALLVAVAAAALLASGRLHTRSARLAT